MELSSCIKPGVLSSLESIKNISEISKNPFSSFFQILQEQQEKKNFSKFPVLAEINSYAHPNEYEKYNQQRQIYKSRKMTFTEEEDLCNDTFNLNQNTSDNLQAMQIESNQNKFNFNVGNNQKEECNQQPFFQDELLSQNFECAVSEYCNGYEEEDQENEEGGANTPGFTSQYQSPQSKCLITDTINKSNSYYTQQNPVSNEFFTRSQQLFEGSPVFSNYFHNNSNNQAVKQERKIHAYKQNQSPNPKSDSILFPNLTSQNVQYKIISKHLERIQKLVEKIKNTQVVRKYILNSQHTDCLEKVKNCLLKQKKINNLPFITSCLQIIRFQLFQQKFNIAAKDKQKQQNLAYQSQVAYQKAFLKLEENYQRTLEQIQSYNCPTENLKYNLKEQLLDSKAMALPQNYEQLIRFISSLRNLINQIYQIKLQQQDQSLNQNNLTTLKRSMSTPTVQIRSQSIFSNFNQSINNLKKSTSIHLASFSNNFNSNSLVKESEFQQRQSENKQLNEGNIPVNSQQNINSFPIFNQKNNIPSSKNQFQNEQNQFFINFSNKNQESQNQNIQLFNLNPQNILNQQQQHISTRSTATTQKDNSNQNESQNVNLFGLSVQKSSRSSSVRSSHFNEDNDICNSPLSTSNNIFNFTNKLQNIVKEDDNSQVCYKNSFSNKFEFLSNNFIEQECPQQEQKEISDFQNNQKMESKNSKLEAQTKSPLIASDNEETALPTFKCCSNNNPFFDYSHTPTIQSFKSSQKNKSNAMFIE
ncbi:hypothetical protein TTHERM_00711960 (macronuclear) [Tetrahymena thermophila SB210]|uniref:Uncharacterized protein n=1 Tax=Tetrahymena thermophila (strain SB210) TaxID=312017 RepID=Q24CZ7_TETTS|nr:hypothetical protein TTHERM_00711960 [Tetrahymena thermophila SB210]EAS05611.2 hypothetical protein TTHERM_00711960 [Tetrahymena thermophila SB210]|eukprot:XP_001025856.2 hypothetical protein TTHERM_00711960 [Tetrahymena thermophila SB210]